MRRSDDDYDDMNGLDDFGADSGRPGSPFAHETAAVTEFLAELKLLGEGPAPEPTPELQALFAGVPSIAAARRNRGPLLRRAALIAAATVVGTTAAAAGHSLPQPAQRVVSDVVNTLTPFHISEDDGLPPHRAPQQPPAGRPGAGSREEGLGDAERSHEQPERADDNEAAGRTPADEQGGGGGDRPGAERSGGGEGTHGGERSGGGERSAGGEGSATREGTHGGERHD